MKTKQIAEEFNYYNIYIMFCVIPRVNKECCCYIANFSIMKLLIHRVYFTKISAAVLPFIQRDEMFVL